MAIRNYFRADRKTWLDRLVQTFLPFSRWTWPAVRYARCVPYRKSPPARGALFLSRGRRGEAYSAIVQSVFSVDAPEGLEALNHRRETYREDRFRRDRSCSPARGRQRVR